ncbi:TPA: Rho termination factor N-terminal domain-containing protein [Streptococcus suis]|uniref:Rho termination factor N-terminal domain-containing protein n=1 Tax=Streptococcus suis TaxID=1307 RepID=UPI0009459AF3|nr:Rho termination factor N-terminal domain-containing protein [Streptococcus suis]MCG9909117.1 Rho termination factor N-terminal domain-containing protein [Streptococcus suis]MCG9933229.1 Rho termination factor N-terminal domain-containing protein [Streptococcus suis]MDN2949050.1 Rho termination factor N-terminal domain-containing protein [Streptococcus suis]MDW8668340.1 Rho termination factor N-terminal domain-containing protein [Streptococcus suis]MEE3692570.1 Rho termination factor N-termi
MGMLLRRHYKVNKSDNDNISKMKISELREIAKQRGLEGYSKLDKDALIKLLGGTDEQVQSY